jgi:hypothetical protein
MRPNTLSLFGPTEALQRPYRGAVKSGGFSPRMPRRAPELLNGQIGRIADLHAFAPEGRKTRTFFVKPTLTPAVA